jgi:hypothetical protein
MGFHGLLQGWVMVHTRGGGAVGWCVTTVAGGWVHPLGVDFQALSICTDRLCGQVVRIPGY